MANFDDPRTEPPLEPLDEPDCTECCDTGTVEEFDGVDRDRMMTFSCTCPAGKRVAAEWRRAGIDADHARALVEDIERDVRLVIGRALPCPDPECLPQGPCFVCLAEKAKARREYEAAVERVTAARITVTKALAEARHG